MKSIQDKCFIGEWDLLYNYSSKLTIEKTGETYKCLWSKLEEPFEYYIGLGLLLENRLIVSRAKLKNENDSLPSGGIGVYRPIGDNRSNSALWAKMNNFDTLGSGIALRKETSSSFEGAYKVRYYLKGYESPVFDLKIDKRDDIDLYSLTWALNNDIALHGIGMLTDGAMALAWGETKVNWELVILNLENEENILECSRGTQINNFIYKEKYKKP